MDLVRRICWTFGAILIVVLLSCGYVGCEQNGTYITTEPVVDNTTTTTISTTSTATTTTTSKSPTTTTAVVTQASIATSATTATTSAKTTNTFSTTSSTKATTSTTTTVPNSTASASTNASTSTTTVSESTSETFPSTTSQPTISPTEATSPSTTVAIATTTSGESKIIIGVVVGVGGAILLALLIIGVVLCVRKRESCCKKTKKPPGHGFSPSHVATILPFLPDKPIPVAQFLDYVAHHQANISAYKTEFESLPPGNKVGKSTSTANEQRNKNFNRYINILPYNDSLVPLSNGDQSGYINASFVDGYRQERPAYIASQAPLAETMDAFWQMIWEHHCGKIVMVTNLFERGQPKCNKYWPNVNETANYGHIRVEAIAERTYGDYILRTFKIKKQPSKEKEKSKGARRSKTDDQEELRETRLIYQFHFTTWPDQGVPNTCTALLKLYRHSIKEVLPECRPGPVVIHCSAGVGRTGTLIALDLSLDRAKDQGTVDIPRCIDKMRRQRMFMVQTVEQYMFIHHVLLEALTLDKVEIPCSSFLANYQQLVEPIDGQSRIQREFKVLEVLKPQFNNTMFSAAQQYMDKNRLSALLPADSFIPYIPNDDETHTYINAIYVYGCPRRAVDDEEEEGSQYGFIATQSPTANTIEDFWAMIKETGSSTIVMLNDLEGVERYWPEDGRTVTFGAYSVTNMGEIASEDIRMTDLQIAVTKKAKAKPGSPPIDESEYSNVPAKESEYANFERQSAPFETETFNIRHFRLLTWPDSLPRETTLISLYGEVVRCQERNPNRPVVVHCLYGAERCGVFCGAMSVLDSIKMECEVDVFNAVKRIRRTRPEFIPDLVQYKFLYDVALDQIKSVDKVDYANTKFSTLLKGSTT